ncbi:MAG: uracil-DNA glycosylase family protein, partial [Candidatus Ferrigenium altingense]
MDRSEAVLRELKLHPQWVRRNQPAPVLAEQPAPITPEAEAEAEAMVPAAVVASTHPAPPLAPASQAGKLNWPELKHRVHDCTACKLRAGCTQTVFGVGDEQAEWLFVGEGPGADEDAQGEPFVG